MRAHGTAILHMYFLCFPTSLPNDAPHPDVMRVESFSVKRAALELHFSFSTCSWLCDGCEFEDPCAAPVLAETLQKSTRPSLFLGTNY